jgi:protocatechuate 3,4-dioxygenase beta subunit
LAAPVAAPKEQPRPAAKKEKPPDEENAPDKTTVTGQVVDEQGKPLAEASVLVVAFPPHRNSARLRKPLPLGSTKTDAQGRFRLVTPSLAAQDHQYARVLSTASGSGMGWQELALGAPRQEVTLTLPREQVFRGRLLDLQGQPARGVKVYVTAVVAQETNKYRSMGFPYPPENLSLWPGPATTDDEGRFSLRGVGRGLRLLLQIRDNRYTTEDWEVTLAAEGKAPVPVHTLAPARLLDGRVTYSDTKKPVPHALLLADTAHYGGPRHFVYGVADAEGRFRIAPYAGDIYSITAYAPEGEPYLARAKGFFTWPKGGAMKYEVNLVLPRGVLLRGKIIEEGSGKPVAGALLGHWSQPRDNPYYQQVGNVGDENSGELRVKSDAAGQFHITVAPGPGHLLVKGPTPDYLHVAKPGADLDKTVGPNRWYYPDTVVFLSHKPGSEPPEMTVMLRRGVTVRGRVLKPDGKPAADLRLACRNHVPGGLIFEQDFLPVRDGRFALPGCDPEKSCPVFFFDAKNQLGAVAELSGKQAEEEVTVRLLPFGAARARLVDERSKPFARQDLYGRLQSAVVLLVSPGFSSSKEGEIQADEIYWQNMNRERDAEQRTDAEGRITLPALIPGAPYRIVTLEKGRRATKKEFAVEAGKTFDLGDIVLQREE